MTGLRMQLHGGIKKICSWSQLKEYSGTTIQTEYSICDIECLLAKWLGATKYKITGKLWLCNATEEKDIDGWDLNGQLAQFSEERWTIIKDSFMIKLRSSSTQFEI